MVRAKRLQKVGLATPAVETMKAIGKWDSLLFLAPSWTEQYMAMCIALYDENVLPRKELELLLIAFDASYAQLYSPYTRRHHPQRQAARSSGWSRTAYFSVPPAGC
jgi:hypothetical protein